MREDLLSIEQVNFIGTNIEKLFQLELSRLSGKNPEHARRVLEFVITLYMEQISTFFTLSVIKDRAESINANSVIRDFVLDLSDKFSFMLTNAELVGGSKLLFTIVESVKRNHGEKTDFTLLHPSLVESLQLDEKVLIDLLNDNFWLLTLYLLVLYFSPLNMATPSEKGKNVKSNR